MASILYNDLYKRYPSNTSWLFYMLSSLILGFAFIFAICSHFIYSDKLTRTSGTDDDQDCLLDDDGDSNPESFSEFDPNATPID